MKKTLALLLMLMLALPLAAGAEDAGYIRQLPQNIYINTNLIAEESYPEVCLTTASVYRVFGKNEQLPLYLCFPNPEGALAGRFEDDYAHFLDCENKIQYSYQLRSSDSYEEFINKADKDEYILLDGTDKTAAYISPSRDSAYGMIGVTEFGKSAKLRITVVLDSFGYRTPDENKVKPLSEIILAEVARVKAAMRIETKGTYWNLGVFRGIKMLNESDHTGMLKIDFPILVENGITPQMAVTDLHDNDIDVICFYEPGNYTKLSIDLESYSYAANMLKDDTKDCYKVSLSNGSEWIVYFCNRQEDDTSSYVHISKAIMDPIVTSDPERPLYFNVLLDGEGAVKWTQDEVAAMLPLFDACCTVMKAADDPYVPQEKPAAPAPAEEAAEPDPAQAPAPADDSWACSSCGQTGNTGKFCPECGAPKPEKTDWTCPNCGVEGNTGKFCPECGAPKP